MAESHPNPLQHPPRDVEGEDIVGWFMIGFRSTDPNHEYPFEVKKDGSILPMIDLVDGSPKLPHLFWDYLADPDIHHVRFNQNCPEGTVNINHDPWSQTGQRMIVMERLLDLCRMHSLFEQLGGWRGYAADRAKQADRSQLRDQFHNLMRKHGWDGNEEFQNFGRKLRDTVIAQALEIDS